MTKAYYLHSALNTTRPTADSSNIYSFTVIVVELTGFRIIKYGTKESLLEYNGFIDIISSLSPKLHSHRAQKLTKQGDFHSMNSLGRKRRDFAFQASTTPKTGEEPAQQ